MTRPLSTADLLPAPPADADRRLFACALCAPFQGEAGPEVSE